MSAGKDLSEFVYMRTYSRWISDLGRRERWEETVERFMGWITKDQPIPQDIIDDMRAMILEKNVMPSMRALCFLISSVGQTFPLGIACKAETIPVAPACLMSRKDTGSFGPNHRHVCSIRLLFFIRH